MKAVISKEIYELNAFPIRLIKPLYSNENFENSAPTQHTPELYMGLCVVLLKSGRPNPLVTKLPSKLSLSFKPSRRSSEK